MKPNRYWTVCQTVSGREHLVRAEIEKGNRGAFLPTIAKTWVSDGKVSARECPMIPGYVFFMTDPEGWGEVMEIDGVQRVLTMGDRAKRVADDEMRRIVLAHAMGSHNSLNARIYGGTSRQRSKSRKPRSGRRIRKATERNRTEIAA